MNSSNVLIYSLFLINHNNAANIAIKKTNNTTIATTNAIESINDMSSSVPNANKTINSPINNSQTTKAPNFINLYRLSIINCTLAQRLTVY